MGPAEPGQTSSPWTFLHGPWDAPVLMNTKEQPASPLTVPVRWHGCAHTSIPHWGLSSGLQPEPWTPQHPPSLSHWERASVSPGRNHRHCGCRQEIRRGFSAFKLQICHSLGVKRKMIIKKSIRGIPQKSPLCPPNGEDLLITLLFLHGP